MFVLSITALAQAGRFFPDTPQKLSQELTNAWNAAKRVPLPKDAEVIISPHAGYRFCADVAARAYHTARKARRVLLLSPSHYEQFDGLAVPSHAGYQAGDKTVMIDNIAREALKKYLRIDDLPHAKEHGIETQIPMLAYWMDAPEVLPVVIGRSNQKEIATFIDAWRAMVTDGLIVLSSDLSHQLNAPQANAHDQGTAALIETGEIAKLNGRHACGWQAIQGALSLPQISGLRSVRLGMTNSSRITGDESATVGYGAWAFISPDKEILPSAARKDALSAARKVLPLFLKNGRPPSANLQSFHASLQGHGASFVTWQIDGQLRGCIGSLKAHRPLIVDIIENACKAAFKDPRFPPVSEAELERLTLKIAVLSKPAPMGFTSQKDLLEQLTPGVDGLILSDGAHRGTFLPMVWESIPEPGDFLNALKRKAGLPEDHWSENLKIQRYQAESFT